MTGFAAERPSLLLVDDDTTFCQVLGRALVRRGFAVTTAHTGTAALQQARVDPPEYAVVDLNLAGDSGLGSSQNLPQNVR